MNEGGGREPNDAEAILFVIFGEVSNALEFEG